jgi:hypothetical protein
LTTKATQVLEAFRDGLDYSIPVTDGLPFCSINLSSILFQPLSWILYVSLRQNNEAMMMPSINLWIISELER